LTNDALKPSSPLSFTGRRDLSFSMASAFNHQSSIINPQSIINDAIEDHQFETQCP
jgi:hypothetical protein